jgi:hypothetical protein
MTVKIFISQMEQKNLTTNPENQELLSYINVYGDAKIKALNELELLMANFMQMYGRKMHCDN